MTETLPPAGIAPMVRIPWNAPENFKRVLDAGAWGVVVPMVNSRAEAEMAAEATRFPPKGKRSVGGSIPAVRFGTTGGDSIAFDLVGRGGEQSVTLAELRAANEGFFPKLMGQDAALA